MTWDERKGLYTYLGSRLVMKTIASFGASGSVFKVAKNLRKQGFSLVETLTIIRLIGV